MECVKFIAIIQKIQDCDLTQKTELPWLQKKQNFIGRQRKILVIKISVGVLFDRCHICHHV